MMSHSTPDQPARRDWFGSARAGAESAPRLPVGPPSAKLPGDPAPPLTRPGEPTHLPAPLPAEPAAELPPVDRPGSGGGHSAANPQDQQTQPGVYDQPGEIGVPAEAPSATDTDTEPA
jgi:hypothetical protein